MQLGMIGLGRMGSNMARRLKDRGWEVTAVYDVNGAAAQSVAAEVGAKVATELREVTQLSEVVLTVVSDDKAMRSIYRGGLLAGARGALAGAGHARGDHLLLPGPG